MPSAIVAAGMAAAGAAYGGITAADSAHYQAQVAKNNATAARQNAGYSASAAAANTESAGLKAAQRLGGVTAAQAANNLDVNTGSAADISTSQRQLGQLDVENEASKGALAVYGYQTQATNFDAQAKADQAQVVPDIVGGLLKAGGSFAGNAAQIGGGGGAGGDVGGGGASGDTSLISSAPDIPEGYSWMNDGSYSYGAADDWDR